MKRTLIAILLSIICVYAADYFFTEYPIEIFECQAATYKHETEMIYVDEERILCSLSMIRNSRYESGYDSDGYEMTFFGKLAEMLVVYVGPVVLGMILAFVVF